ncbi:MAG: MliC family protein [bacterium]
MKIIWNKVTWFSQVVAIILFVAVFFVGLTVGKKLEREMILGERVTEARFVCGLGGGVSRIISADFYPRAVRLQLPGVSEIYLTQTISASGARYANADESFVFWNKGNTAFVEQNGTTTISDCVTK